MEKKDCEKENETKTPDFLKTAEEYLARERRLFLWGAIDDESAEKTVKPFVFRFIRNKRHYSFH